MNKLTDWSLAQKLKASNKHGIMIGIAIAVAIILIVAAIIIKMRWMKKHFGCSCCDADMFDADFLDDDDDDDYNVANDKDFV